VQRALGALFQRVQALGLVGATAGGNDDVRGGLEELPCRLETDAAGRPAMPCPLSRYEAELGTYPVMSHVVVVSAIALPEVRGRRR
jgi:hypothetical protein